jgi:putative ABC transport system permease protein
MSTRAFFDSLGRDLHYSLRGIARRPGFTFAVVLTLALGIGANTAIFGVVNGVLLKPLPYPEPDELVSISHVAPGLSPDPLGVSPSMHFTYLDENRAFEALGAWGDGGQSLTGIGAPEQVRALFVTPGVLPALGVPPLHGRTLTDDDAPPGGNVGPSAIMLTYAFWQRRFGGDEAAVGRDVMIDGNSARVIGVMPRNFKFLDMTPAPDVIAPLNISRDRAFIGNFGLRAIGRLKDGVTREAAAADIERMLPVWLDAWPPAPNGLSRETVANWRIAPAVQPLKEQVVGSASSMLWVLMGTIGAVLLIACANVANLMLVRAESRRHELSVRAMLGAGSGRIAKELLVESLVLGALGGVLGLAVAALGLQALVMFGPTNLPRLQEISIDPLVLLFATGAALLSSLLFGVLPAVKYARVDASPHAARGSTAGRDRHLARNSLVVVQVAVALVLIVSSGLMIRTFQELRSVEPGFTDAGEVQIARISVGPIERDARRYTQMQRDVLDGIAAIPGVTAASFAVSVPLEGRIIGSDLYVEDRAFADGEVRPTRRFKFVSPGYFETLGTRMIAGRDIEWADIDARRPVSVISASLARELWGSPAAALGKRIRESAPEVPGPWREVIGVVQDIQEDALNRSPPTMVYWPVLTEQFWGNEVSGVPAVAYAIRSERAGTETFVNEVREAVWAVNPDLPVFLVRTMQDLYAASLARTSFTLVILAIAGALALALGVVGVYGVLSYVISQRTREIGIRLALGEPPAAVQRRFVRHGLALAALGIAAGLGGAVLLTRLMASLLYGVDPLDAATYVAALGTLLVAAALASYLPARRATNVNPVETLRAE